MPKIIEMRLSQEYFEKDRDNNLEARLAKFKLHKGDILRFREWNETKKLIPEDSTTNWLETFTKSKRLQDSGIKRIYGDMEFMFWSYKIESRRNSN